MTSCPSSIVSWNVNSLRARLEHIDLLLKESNPALLALQETKLTDVDFPQQHFQDLGYHLVFSGQKSYNGVAIISRQPAHDVILEPAFLNARERRVIAASYGSWRVINAYVVNGREVGSESYHHKLEWLSHLCDFVAEQLAQYENLLLVGDFNIAPADADVHDVALWRDRILCSVPERDALQRLLALGLTDCFRCFTQPADSFSWWDYRAGAFWKNRGLRIDLILASEALASRCVSCDIDKGMRQRKRPSDHAPVIARW